MRRIPVFATCIVVLIPAGCSQKVNLPPAIERVSPDQEEQTVLTLRDYTFSVTAHDPEGATVTVRWFLNGEDLHSYSFSVTVNLEEEWAGTEMLLEAEASDGRKTSKVDWNLNVLSPLYLTRKAVEALAHPDAISGVYADKTLRNWYILWLKNSFRDADALYSGHDFDNDSVDDAYYVQVTGHAVLGVLLFVDALVFMETAGTQISTDALLYAVAPYPGSMLPGVIPGNTCSVLTSPNSLLWVIAESLVPEVEQRASEILETLSPLLNSGDPFEIEISGVEHLSLIDQWAWLFRGKMDTGDIYLMGALINAVLGMLQYLSAYSTDTFRGLLSYFFDPCYYLGPWADSDNFPQFGVPATVYAESLAGAKENILSSVSSLARFFQLATRSIAPASREMTGVDEYGRLFLPFGVVVNDGVYVLALTGFDWIEMRRTLQNFVTAISNGYNFPLTSLFQTEITFSDLWINTSRLFSEPLTLSQVLPLFIESDRGEYISDTPNGTSRLYDLPEPCLDVNFDGVCSGEEDFADLDENGAYTGGDAFIDDSWPNGVLDGLYSPPGAFYYERETSFFYDTGRDGLMPYSNGYPGPDPDGSQNNGLYEPGEPVEGGTYSQQSTTHTWPDVTGTRWASCTSCTGTDPDNGVIDEFYLFFPDPTLSGLLVPGAAFDPDGSGGFSNGDLNAALSVIRHKLGKSRRFIPLTVP